MSFFPDLKKLDSLEFFHDEPDSVSDVFGYHQFCNDLACIITEQKDTPFSILIHGEWGSGKTSVLKKTEEILNDLENKDENFEVILFEVWKYEKVDPVASLLQEISNTFGGENSGKFGSTVKSVGLLLFDMAIRAHTHLTLKEAKEYFVESQAGIRNLRTEMETLMRSKKLVILFDDLDRCSFETMLELVEAIRLFLSVQGVISVVAADNERLRSAWRFKYPSSNENETDEYFEKIFQLQLALPDKENTSISDYMNTLKRSYIGDKEKSLIGACTSNPRKIKQILNLIFFGLKYSKLNSKFSADNISSYFPILVTWSIIRMLYSSIGRIIQSHHTSLNESLDFISLVKSWVERNNQDAKIETSEQENAEKVYRIIKEFQNYDHNHFLRQKAKHVSIWTLECSRVSETILNYFYSSGI